MNMLVECLGASSGVGAAAPGGCENHVMIILLKLAAAAGIAWGVLNGGFAPRAEDCECSGKADTKLSKLVPRGDADCACKADAATVRPTPRAADCSCKADAD